ncbi:MAG: hypothetical protein R3Y57_02525 [Erysipelotrichaceae bacterium]
MTIISGLICVSVIVYVIWLSNMKKNIRVEITNFLQEKRFQDLSTYINQKTVKFVLKEEQYDLYDLLALFELKKIEDFNDKLEVCKDKRYKEDGKLELMVYFYHTFLVKEDKEYAVKLKNILSNIEDEMRMMYHQQLFELTFDEDVNFINDMECKVEKEYYIKNDLAIVCYFLAVQHLKSGNVEIARIYRDSAQRYIYVESPYLDKIIALKKKIEDISKDAEV